MKWSDLSPKQKALGLKRYHARQDAKVSPAASKALAQKQALAQEVAPGLTRGDLLAQVQSGTRQKFGDAEAALGDSFRQNAAQTARTSDWFGQYRSAINQAAQQQAAQNQAAVQGVQNLQQGLNQDSQQQWAGQNQAMTADAANRGATVDPTLADKAHNGSDIRGMLTNSYGAMLLNQGNAQQTDLSNRAATSVQQRNEALAGKQTERAGLQRDRTRLKQQKGDFKITYAADLKDAASKSALASALSQAQLAQAGIKIQDTKANIANTNADTVSKTLKNQYLAKYGKLPSTGANQSPLDAYRLAYLRKHGYFPPTGPAKAPTAATGKDAFGNTGLQRTNRTSDFQKALLTGGGLIKKSKTLSGLGVIPIGQRGPLVNEVLKGLSVVYPTMNINVLRGVAQRLVLGHIDGKTKKALKHYGVTI